MNSDYIFSWAESSSSGELVHVDTVPRGAECGCICPNCREPLVARQGDILAHGFAHHSESRGVTLKICYMVTLYKLAEQIIQKAKRVRVPSYYGIYKEADLEFDNVEIDNRFDREDKQPDIIATAHDGTQYLIELSFQYKVQHKSDNDYVGLTCLRIDLTDQTLESLEKFLLESSKNRKWINNEAWFKGIEDLYKRNGKNVRLVDSEQCEQCPLSDDCCAVMSSRNNRLTVQNNGSDFYLCKTDLFNQKLQALEQRKRQQQLEKRQEKTTAMHTESPQRSGSHHYSTRYKKNYSKRMPRIVKLLLYAYLAFITIIMLGSLCMNTAESMPVSVLASTIIIFGLMVTYIIGILKYQKWALYGFLLILAIDVVRSFIWSLPVLAIGKSVIFVLWICVFNYKFRGMSVFEIINKRSQTEESSQYSSAWNKASADYKKKQVSDEPVLSKEKREGAAYKAERINAKSSQSTKDNVIRPVPLSSSSLEPALPSVERLAKKVYDSEYIANLRIGRSWVLPQMIERGFDEHGVFDKKRYSRFSFSFISYEKCWKLMLHNYKVLSDIHEKDQEGYASRACWWSKEIAVAILEYDNENFCKEMEIALKRTARGDIQPAFDSVKQKYVVAIDRVKEADGPLMLYRAINKYSKLHSHRLDISPSPAFMNAYMGDGAYVSMMNLVKFHGLYYFDDQGCLLTREECLADIQRKAKDFHYDGERMFDYCVTKYFDKSTGGVFDYKAYKNRRK